MPLTKRSPLELIDNSLITLAAWYGYPQGGVVCCVAAKEAITMAKKRANGEGNIRKRKDGRWEGRYTAGYDATTGKRIIRNVLGKTQAEVKEKLKVALEEVKGIDVTRSEDYTIATWLRTWYELYAKPNVRTATANRYELIIEYYTIPRIGSVKLKKLTTRHLQKLYKELLESGRIHIGKNQDKGLSTTTVRSVHLMLHCALDRAVKERLIQRNPSEDCIVPKPRKLDMKILPPEHIHAYLEAAQARGILPMFYLELASGMRKGELVALRWEDVDIQSRTISVSRQYVRNPDGSLELSRPKTENSVAGVHPANSSGTTAPGAREASRQPLPVPFAPHRGDVPPGLGGEPAQEDPKGRRAGTSSLP